jgi:hypothetical protein
MARYVDIESLGIGRKNRDVFNVPELADGWNSLYDLLKEAPTADVAEVVRCEKCKDFESHGNGKAGICRNKKLKPCLRYATDFCSYGKRRDT